MIPILRVLLSLDHEDFLDVPLSPDTVCRDVLQLCQEPDRVVDEEENILELLHTEEAQYILKHTQTNVSCGLGAGVERAVQNQVLSAPEETSQRLKQFAQKLQDEQETLQKLREKHKSHEAKLQKIRSSRVTTETRRRCSSKAEEVEQLSALFRTKQMEMAVAAATVQRLTNQLQAIRRTRFDGQLKARLQRELQIRTLNLDRGSGLDHQKELTEQRLNQLRHKLWNQKNPQRSKDQVPHLVPGCRVAAVGPYLQALESGLRPPPRPAKPVSDVPPPLPTRTNHSEVYLNVAPPPVPMRTNRIADIQPWDKELDSNMAAVPPPLPRKCAEVSAFRSSTLPRPQHRAPPTSSQATPPQTVTAASILSLYTTGGRSQYQAGHGTLPRSKPRAPCKPVGSASEAEFCFGRPVSTVTAEEACQPRPLSPTKLLPFLSGGPRAGLLHAPRPLKKRSSLCEPEGAPQLLRLRYQRTTLAALEGGGQGGGHGGGPGGGQGGGQGGVKAQAASAFVEKKAPMDKEYFHLEIQEEVLTPPPLPPRAPISDSAHRHLLAPPTGPDSWDESGLRSPRQLSPPVLKSILRASGSEDQTRAGLRVRFNPVSLLLDAALEGEFDLVQRIIYEVPDASVANDEGITALHNAVCAGHSDIVHFLVQFGVNVNAADSDGWTPLHCAASCNNTSLCELLLESGAAVFASTLSDSQTAADKCEDQEEDYQQCSQFLYGVQEKMGVMNRAQVFALWNFEAQDPDESDLCEGECVTVLRPEPLSDALWWRVRGARGEGYVPRNLLGIYPRIKPRQRSLA